MVVGAMRSAYRGYTDPDCPRPLRRLFERTVDVANPFDGAAPRRRTPPPVGGDTTGPKKCSLLQWLFEGPYDAAFDATGEGYVPELAYHAYRTRGGVDRGRDASLPGGPTDPAVVEDLLAAGKGQLEWTTTEDLCRRCSVVMTSLPSVAIIALVAEKYIIPHMRKSPKPDAQTPEP